MSLSKLNLNNRKLWAIIPAAGSGRRFSKSELKQYQIIQDKTVLEHTVERITQLPLSGYVLAISESDNFAKTIDFSHADILHFCLGGQERVDSVLNGLIYLSEIADPDDFVFVHDAARPCVNRNNLESLVQHAVEKQVSCILATPVRDTLKQVITEDHIDRTVDRNFLWQAQTPQISTISKLKSAIENALLNKVNITDEASALEFAGESVDVVLGRSDNIKITYPEDLALAQLIIQSQIE